MPISVLLVEDHELLRMGIKASLSKDQAISVIGEAKNGAEAIDKVSLLHPDVIIMDLAMPVMDGIQSSRLIKQFDTHSKIIILSSYQEEAVICSALSSGASGYCSKDAENQQLRDAIIAVNSGKIWLDPSLISPSLQLSLNNVRSNQNEMLSATIDEALSTSTPQEQSVTRAWYNVSAETHSLHGLKEKFEHLAVLGKGGMSVVHKVRHRLLNKVFAIKFLCSSLATSEHSIKRFQMEAQITSQLSHANIIAVHDYGIAPDGQPFILMDFAPGLTIADVLNRDGKIPEQEARPIFKQIADALFHAHSRGIVHRDVKPSNVLLTRDEDGRSVAKLLDFGLAKMTDGKIDGQNLTQSGLVIGSPLYMSPEQCRTSDLTDLSDIYSFGCLMYEVICGKPPFRGSSPFDTMLMHVSDQPEEPLSTDCSPSLKQILQRCLCKDPNMRPGSIELSNMFSLKN